MALLDTNGPLDGREQGLLDPKAPAQEVESLLRGVAAWAGERRDVVAVALVGSWARGAAGQESDVDLVIMTTDPSRYVDSDAWADPFEVSLAKTPEPWGAVTSRRGRDATGLEIEFGFTTPEWPGGDGVLREGARIVHDPNGVLAKLMR